MRQEELATYASRLQGEIASVEQEKFHLAQVPNAGPVVAAQPVSELIVRGKLASV